MLINSNVGIRMCHNKQIRSELGTINYNPIISLKKEKINFEEFFQQRKEKSKKQKKKTLKKTIQLKGKTNIDENSLKEEKTPKEELEIEIDEITEGKEKKEEQLEDFIDLLQKKESKETDEIDKIEETEETDKIEETEETDKIDSIDETEETKNVKQKSMDDTKKKIIVTNLTVDKDKEMFQM